MVLKKKEKKEKKAFVLDTSVILYDHNAVKNFEEHDVAIPITVLEELDNFKKGNDIINFTGGADTISGGAGADTLNWSNDANTGESVSRITDFNPAEGDRISLSSAAFPGLEQVRYKVANNQQQLSRLSRRSTNLIYAASEQALYYDANGSQSGWGRTGGVFAYLSGDARPDRSSFVVEPGL